MSELAPFVCLAVLAWFSFYLAGLLMQWAGIRYRCTPLVLMEVIVPVAVGFSLLLVRRAYLGARAALELFFPFRAKHR